MINVFSSLLILESDFGIQNDSDVVQMSTKSDTKEISTLHFKTQINNKDEVLEVITESY